MCIPDLDVLVDYPIDYKSVQYGSVQYSMVQYRTEQYSGSVENRTLRSGRATNSATKTVLEYSFGCEYSFGN